MALRQQIAEKVYRRRKERGWTQYDLAEVSGVHVNTVSNIERGMSASTVNVEKVMDALGIWDFGGGDISDLADRIAEAVTERLRSEDV